MTALLDTSVLIAGVPDDVDGVAISVITVAELTFGVRRAADVAVRAVRKARLATVLEFLEPIPVSVDVAAAWADLATLAAERGRQPRRRAMDLLIAATAHVHGLTLLTRDPDLLWLEDVLDVRCA